MKKVTSNDYVHLSKVNDPRQMANLIQSLLDHLDIKVVMETGVTHPAFWDESTYTRYYLEFPKKGDK